MRRPEERRTTGRQTELPPIRRTTWAIRSAVALVCTVVAVGIAVVGPQLIVLVAPVGRAPDSGTAVALRVVAAGACAGCAVALVYCWWRCRLEFLARRPGPITVLPFQDQSGHPGAAPDPALVADYKARFERHLVACRFTRVEPVPSADRPADFLSVVEAAGNDAGGLWGAALRFVRLLAPVSAYQVSCTVQPATDEWEHVLLVEVRRTAGLSVAPDLVGANTKERVIERAAHVVAARILPRTRLCREAPWKLWRDRHLPSHLYDSYQRFHSLQTSRHFDEAIAAVRRAVRDDPGNLSMRLDLGKLQERMQLYLDALLTYDDIITVAAQTDRELAEWWSPADKDVVPKRSRGRELRADDPVILIARYRHAMMLGISETIAGQWWGRPERCAGGEHQTAREWRRAYLRSALANRFARRHLGARPEVPAFLGNLREAKDDDRVRRTAEARVFFATLARQEFEHLVRDYVVRRRWVVVGPVRDSRWVRRRSADVLPHGALLMGLPWAAMRQAMAVSWAHGAGCGGRVGPVKGLLLGSDPLARRAPRAMLTEIDKLAAVPWPPRDLGLIERVIDRLTSDHRAAPRTWRSHFNTACVLALPLLPDGPDESGESSSSTLDPATTDLFALRSVVELRKAVSRADRDFISRQRDWLLSEDPDLDHLREHRTFKDFEARTFGSIGHAVQRGPDIHRWEQSTYVARFICAAAREMHSLWHARRKARPDTAAHWHEWLDEETAGWGLAERLALDSRNSHTREDVARLIAETGSLRAFRRPHVRHPSFSDVRLDRQLASMDGVGQSELLTARYHGDRPDDDRVRHRVTTAIRRSDERLKALACCLRVEGPSRCGCTLGLWSVLAEEEAVLRGELMENWRRDPTGAATIAAVRQWADVSARRWESLAEWFDDEAFGHGVVENRSHGFRVLIAQDWWVVHR